MDATDQGNEGTWKTKDGKELGYTNWASSIRAPTHGNRQNCAYQHRDGVNGVHGGEWDDAGCNDHVPCVICEYKIGNVASPLLLCR